MAEILSMSWLCIFAPLALGLAILFIITFFFPFLAFSIIFFLGALGVLIERGCCYLECRWEKKKGRKRTEEDL